MANQGASVQKYVTDLVKILEGLEGSRDEIDTQITKEQTEKDDIERNIESLSIELQDICEALKKKYTTLEEYRRTIDESEGAFNKIVESSQTLLHVTKKEKNSLSKKKTAVMNAKPQVQE
jgi:Sjoegren syndrome nuclear autoantigen 1